jgi:hypothetical protein
MRVSALKPESVYTRNSLFLERNMFLTDLPPCLAQRSAMSMKSRQLPPRPASALGLRRQTHSQSQGQTPNDELKDMQTPSLLDSTANKRGKKLIVGVYSVQSAKVGVTPL